MNIKDMIIPKMNISKQCSTFVGLIVKKDNTNKEKYVK